MNFIEVREITRCNYGTCKQLYESHFKEYCSVRRKYFNHAADTFVEFLFSAPYSKSIPSAVRHSCCCSTERERERESPELLAPSPAPANRATAEADQRPCKPP